MRWPIYFILAYLAVGVQAGLDTRLRIFGAGPNLVLLVAVFIAINAPREPALLGCFALGVMQDLLSGNRLGLHALSYGVFALMAAGWGNVIVRSSPVVHFILALLGGSVLAVVQFVSAWVTPGAGSPWRTLGLMMISAAYTAVLAPLVIWLLNRLRRYFAFESPRRRVRAW